MGAVGQRSGRRVADQPGHHKTRSRLTTEGAIRQTRQALSRPQDGKYRIGATQTYRRFGMRAARQDRHWLLSDMERERERERTA